VTKPTVFIWRNSNVAYYMAKELNTNLVRIMSYRKEMILFGTNGAEEWVVSGGAWDKLMKMLEEPVQVG